VLEHLTSPCPALDFANLASKISLNMLITVRKMIFSIKVFVTLFDYLKIPQVAI
jgi:hypothetical protein